MPQHPPYYDKDAVTDRPERFFAAEMLREAIFEHYMEEARQRGAVAVQLMAGEVKSPVSTDTIP